jgi:hypothetical protein
MTKNPEKPRKPDKGDGAGLVDETTSALKRAKTTDVEGTQNILNAIHGMGFELRKDNPDIDRRRNLHKLPRAVDQMDQFPIATPVGCGEGFSCLSVGEVLILLTAKSSI